MQRTCACGSGLPKRDLIDARGIFCAYVCDACEESRKGKYRDEIFTDANYETTEDVEPDEWL